MDDPGEQRQLEEKLKAVDEAFRQEYAEAASSWHVNFGPIHIPFVIGSQLVAKIYTLFNILCFAVGVAFCFLRGVLSGLGIALVVGSLFAMGAFVSQFWMAVHSRESQLADRMYSEAKVARLQQLAQERSELYKKIEGLRNADESPERSSVEPTD